jgi:hypothetical protein
VRGVIVDLDRSSPREPGPADWAALPHLALWSCALVLGCIVFTLAVWTTRPPTAPAAQPAASVEADTTGSTAPVPRGVQLRPLLLPTRSDVDLAFMPDRLANEAPSWTLRSVVVIRGAPGVASVEGPAVIAWTENGIAYWMTSPTRTTSDLIDIANQLK